MLSTLSEDTDALLRSPLPRVRFRAGDCIAHAAHVRVWRADAPRVLHSHDNLAMPRSYHRIQREVTHRHKEAPACLGEGFFRVAVSR